MKLKLRIRNLQEKYWQGASRGIFSIQSLKFYKKECAYSTAPRKDIILETALILCQLHYGGVRRG